MDRRMIREPARRIPIAAEAELAERHPSGLIFGLGGTPASCAAATR